MIYPGQLLALTHGIKTVPCLLIEHLDNGKSKCIYIKENKLFIASVELKNLDLVYTKPQYSPFLNNASKFPKLKQVIHHGIYCTYVSNRSIAKELLEKEENTIKIKKYLEKVNKLKHFKNEQ